MNWPPNWQRSPQPYSQPPQWDLQTEHRLTKAEGKLEHHEQKHDAQKTWNKTFTVALMSLGTAVAQGKAENLADLVIWLAQSLKP